MNPKLTIEQRDELEGEVAMMLENADPHWYFENVFIPFLENNTEESKDPDSLLRIRINRDDSAGMGFLHALENNIDKGLEALRFGRIGTTKGQSFFEIKYKEQPKQESKE